MASHGRSPTGRRTPRRCTLGLAGSVVSRFQTELAALASLAADPGLGVPERVTAALTLHSRVEGRGCLCGWFRLGASFARHQAEELKALGLLKD
jgi:hypothetical protein